MGKIPLLAALLVFATLVAACTREVEVVKEVEVTREVQVAVMTAEQLETAFTTAFGAGDLAAFSEILADDFVFTQVPGPGGTEKLTLTGKSAYMIRLAGRIEDNQQLTVSEQVHEGDRTTGKFSVTGDNFRAMGIDALTGTYESTRRNGKLATLDTVIDGPSLQKLGAALAAARGQAGPSNTVAFQDFGWDPDTKGARGSVSYRPIAGSFSGKVEVAGLKASHAYNLYFMNVGVTGDTTLDSTTYGFTTDAQGAAKISVSKTFDVAEKAPVPAYQVHFLVVDDAVDLADPPNPLGIKHPIALACSFPLGFLQLDVPGLPAAALSGDKVPLFNFGWAPGFTGGTGSVAYTGQNAPFEATLNVGDLKPSHKYSVVMMGSPLNGAIESKEFIVNTDPNGAASIAISHEFTAPEGVPLPAYQVHFLVIDRSETLDNPPNPFGIKNPIVLACMFPLGFVQLGLGPTTIQAAAPIPAIAMGEPIPGDKGYLVEELGDGLYWVTDGTYQAMFLTTGEGVIAVDAPPSIVQNYLKAIAEVTDEPVTHVIYSHSHADHIAGAGKFPKDATYIAHEDTAAQLARTGRPFPFGTFVGGSPVPPPTVTFSDKYTLNVGSQTLELEYRGPNHERGNIFIYAPKQKVLLLIDVIFPGWSPFLELAVTEDVPAFVKAHDDILSFDFGKLVSGHLGRLATREDVETQREYVMDMQANAAKALQTVDFMGVAQATGFENPWSLFGTYLDAVAQECADLTISKWTGRLAGADLFTVSHCARLLESLRID